MGLDIISEEYIERNSDKVNWRYIFRYQKLSEGFIDKHIDKIDWISWMNISIYHKLSEEFIEKYSNKLNWNCISMRQELSEKFIEKHSDKVGWNYISSNQKLSEEFIEKHADKVRWSYISAYQVLSEEFIEKYSDKVFWLNISKYQKLSPKFIEKHGLKIPETCWLYKDKEFKRKYIKQNTEYEIIGDKVIAYKSCKLNGYSTYNFQYKYEVGREYEAHADYNIDNDSSFGLSAWTKGGALEYYNKGNLYKVEIDLDDIAAIVRKNNKIRAKKIKIIEEVTV